MSDNIPFEIQAEIFKRLPAKTFIQCKSLSKTWKSLIESPEFIADYNNLQARRQRLLVRWYESEYFPYKRIPYPKSNYIYVVEDDTFPKHKFATTLHADMQYFPVHHLQVVGSSQGLLCLFGDYQDAYDIDREIAFIWNPSIKKTISVNIPVCHERRYCSNRLGFGVSPNTSDPMIVKFNDCDLVDDPRNVEIFTLSSWDWDLPRGNTPRKSINYTWYMTNIAIDSFIYFMGHESGIHVMFSFDMASEEFTEINLPNDLAHRYFTDVSISKLKGSPVLLEYDNEGEKHVCAVWAMKHGVPNVFTKLFTINTPDSVINKVLEFTKNGEPIMQRKVHEDGEHAALVVYEQSSGYFKDLGIYGEIDSVSVSSYNETLLLLDHPKFRKLKRVGTYLSSGIKFYKFN